ncbi:hypothetical protein DNC80_14185, partial [Flavobacterium sp. SOK18b]|nr:hypothetical protein [Flavobacterium sp. SOK18b]
MYTVNSSAQVTANTNPSNAQINLALQGPGIVITGGTLVGAQTDEAILRSNQVATFTNGITGAGLGFPSGAFFSTGNAAFDLANRNTEIQRSDNPAAATLSDPDLSTIDGTAINDLVAYTFTITLGPTITGLKIGYHFGSEEYPDYVGTNFDDAFGFFISGPGITGNRNLATTPAGSPTSINKINGGFPGVIAGATPVAAYDGTQSALYINNGHSTTVSGGAYVANTPPQPGPFPIFSEFNGVTRFITRTVNNLTPGGTYTFKVVIADAGDASLDSGVFLNLIEGLTNADLQIAKAVNNPSPNVGSNVTFTLTASNLGPGAATGVNVTDVLPAGYTFVSALPSVGTYDNTTGLWLIGDLANGGNATLSIVARVNASGSYINTATIAGNETDPVSGNNADSRTTSPVPQANVGIVKIGSSATATVGNNVTFTLTANNAGPSPATGVIVNDVLPAGYSFVSALPSVGTYNSGTGIWSIGNLANGASASLSIVARVNATGSYVNTAMIAANEADPISANNTSKFTIVPYDATAQRNCNSTATTANLSFQNPVFVSGSNNGIADEGDVYRFPNVTTGVDALVTISAIFGSGGTPSLSDLDKPAVTEGVDGFDEAFQPSMLTNGGNPVAFTFTFNFVTAGGTIANPVRLNYYASALDVDGDNANLREYVEMNLPDARFNSNPTNLTFATTGTSFRGTATTSAVQPGTGVAPGFAYTAYFENRSSMVITIGSMGGTNVERLNSIYFRDITYPGRESTVLTTPLLCGNVSVQGGGVISGSTINLTGPNNQTTTTDASGNYSFVIPIASLGTYTVTQTNLAGFSNFSDVEGANDSVINNNIFGFASITGRNFVDASSNVSVVKTVNNATPIVGSNVTFTLAANNVGPSDATAVVVNDLLPSGYTYASDNGAGAYNSGTGVWTIGNLNNGSSTTLSIVATVNATGSYANTATISANETDPTPGNNTSTSTIVVQLDSDNDGVGNFTDLDDDNDGIRDIVEDCQGYLAQNSNGVWKGSTASNVTYTFTGAVTQTAVATLTDNQTNFYVNISGGEQRYAKSGSANFTVNFSTPVPANQIAFNIGDVDGTIGSSAASYTFSVNGGAANNNFRLVTLASVNPDLNYNPASGAITSVGSIDDQRIMLAGVGTNLISSINVTGSNIGSGDLVAYSFFAKVECDTDLDGIPNYLDLDSDNDGCSDSNEYYNNTTSAAAGQQFGQTGGAVAPVLANGKVNLPAATYTGSYANVINSTVFTACQIIAGNDTLGTPAAP